MREKRPRRVNVRLLHDNARPHVAKLTQKKLLEFGWDTVPHPPYSPDLAPCDYHLFGPLKRFLHNKKFGNVQDINFKFEQFLNSQRSSFRADSIATLLQRWTKVFESDGAYIVD